jgi:RND family efflux transporter MFP subunit
VTVRDVSVEVRAPVDLRPLAQADVGSKTLGYLDAVLVDRGDRVRRGQLLALVRPSDLPDQLSAARSSLEQTRAQLALARANAERAKGLAPVGVVSQQELQQAMAAESAAEAQEKALSAQLGALATRLGETRITSPLDGVVWQRRLDPGALVGLASGATILTVAKIDTLRAFVAVNERYATQVAIGQRAFVELDALGGKRVEGKVVRLAPGFDATTRTLEAEVRIDNTDGTLRPGMYGRGGIVLATHPQAIVVPIAGVQISDKGRSCFVLAGEAEPTRGATPGQHGLYKVARRAVQTGVDGGDWLEVTAGLKPEDEIVVAGADGLSDGATVRVARNNDR